MEFETRAPDSLQRVTATCVAYFFGSATTIAMASPRGETASRDTAPKLCAAASNTSVQPAAPRVHEKIFVPLDIRSVRPLGIQAMSWSVLPSTALTSGSIAFDEMSICLI